MRSSSILPHQVQKLCPHIIRVTPKIYGFDVHFLVLRTPITASVFFVSRHYSTKKNMKLQPIAHFMLMVYNTSIPTWATFVQIYTHLTKKKVKDKIRINKKGCRTSFWYPKKVVGVY